MSSANTSAPTNTELMLHPLLELFNIEKRPSMKTAKNIAELTAPGCTPLLTVKREEVLRDQLT